MCGIAGLISAPGMPKGAALDGVGRMTERMRLRGPDAEGVWASTGIVLGHRRLAILDLDARANQPMLSSDGRYAIVFNGEIYNFRELRRACEGDGVAFRTTSDTEILLALFARDGERMLPRLRGMFAFAIWDTQTRELFMARDPYGIKPLFYYGPTKNGFHFRFTSQGAVGLWTGIDEIRASRAGGVLSLGQRAGAVDAVPRCARPARGPLAAGACRRAGCARLLAGHPHRMAAK